MERKCYELRLQFETRFAFKLFRDFGEKDMKKEVLDFLDSFYAYYEDLKEEDKSKLFKNFSQMAYHKADGWELSLNESDEETLSFRNNQSFIRLTKEEESGNTKELEIAVKYDPQFLQGTLPGNAIELVNFETRDASFSKYNPHFLKLLVSIDKKSKETKYTTVKGSIFGEKQIVQEVLMTEIKKQEEKE